MDPRALRKAFKRVLGALQRGKALEDYPYWAGHAECSLSTSPPRTTGSTPNDETGHATD